MNNIVVDTSAWIEYFNGTEKGSRVRERIVSAGSFALTTGLIAAELASKLVREGKPAEEAITALRSITVLVPFNFPVAQETAKIYLQQRKVKPKFGIVDAHVVAAAKLNGAKVITCDNDFAGLSEAIVIK